jgi:hypothetical protein
VCAGDSNGPVVPSSMAPASGKNKCAQQGGHHNRGNWNCKGEVADASKCVEADARVEFQRGWPTKFHLPHSNDSWTDVK